MTPPSTQESLRQVLGSMVHVSRVVQGAEVHGLVRGAASSGLLAACVEPVTVADLATRLGRGDALVADICRALDAHGVLVRDGDRYQLSAGWEPMVDPLLGGLMDDMLAYGAARAAMVEALVTAPETYWNGNPEHQLAVARGVTLDPRSPMAVAVVRMMYDALPDVCEVLSAGGRYLELGCGVAGTLLCSLQVFPRMTATGIELSDRLVAEARERASELAVADRVRFVAGDVAAFSDDDCYDVAFWSQFFFPTSTRADALGTAYRSLRHGGTLLCPLMAEPSLLSDKLHSDDGRDAAMDRLVHGSWGVPARGADDLADELEEAGFVNVRVIDRGFQRTVLGVRP
jgi:SAM-dependent methyltransferase